MEYIIAHTTIAFDLLALVAAIIFVLTAAVCMKRMHDLKKVRKELEEQLGQSGRSVETGFGTTAMDAEFRPAA